MKRIRSVPAISRDGIVREGADRAPRPQASYLRDTRAGHIASRPTVLREHRDEIRRAWDRAAGLAMDLIQNSGRLKGACDQILADTVGTELTCNPQPDLSGLGYSDKERADLISLIKLGWKQYAWNPAECDFRGKLTIPQMGDIGVRWWIAYGESTALSSYMGPGDRRRYGIRTGSKTLMVPPLRLVRETREAERLYQGVFHDDNGRATRYRFNSRVNGINLPKDYEARDRNGMQQVLHVFDAQDASDVRGISLLAPTFRKHIQHEILDDATLQMAVLQTIFAVTLTSDQVSKDAFEALQALDDEDFTDEYKEYFLSRLDQAAGSKINISGDPTVSHLAPGEKLAIESAKIPGGEYLPFAASLSRDMARALGVTYGGLTMDYQNATYSSVRMETSALWPVVLRRRERIAAPHYQMPYEAWLDEAIGTGRIPFKGGYAAFSANRDRVSWCLWQGPAKPTADDGKAAKASSERIGNGTTTLAQECADLGLDPDEVFQQRQIEHQRYLDAGMPSPFARGVGGDGRGTDRDEEKDSRAA